MIWTVIGWTYVVLLMAVAEATSRGGTLLGALSIALFYGALPLALVIYIWRTPARRRARRAADSALDPDGSGHAPGDAVAAERKES